MKNFTYKDIGQHGPSHSRPTRPAETTPKPSRAPAIKLHKKKTAKSVTLVRQI